MTDERGKIFRYEKLLLATGGTPRPLIIPGGNLDGICYFRTFDDYQRLRPQTADGRSAVVIGGGFIGSELAASLNQAGVRVTMVFPDDYLCQKVFPESLGVVLRDYYLKKGITILNNDKPTAFAKMGDKFLTRTSRGSEIESDLVIVGVGIAPATQLAENAGLTTGNGIAVNGYLQTSDPNIYAAGDNALFPCPALDKIVRMEHWDNALNQGRQAGKNMAGANEPYRYLPYFFSDLFDFGYEAVGEVDVRLEIFADWQEENRTGVIYYLAEDKVRGVMLCNVWDKVDAARRLIESRHRMTRQDLAGALR